MSLISRLIHINGIVQGVGFRPFIYNLAIRNNLQGWVRNSASGVDIEITGTVLDFESFYNAILTSPPPLSQIDSIEVTEIPFCEFSEFSIIKSQDQSSDFIPISPDVAICQDCRSELFNPSDRRYLYPFINCTNCGPRFSIIQDIPYDRPKTSMSGFEMCEECREEYENPLDRRFHAQPIACYGCGPGVWLETGSGERLSEQSEAIQESRRLIADGKILAIKGLGGFHLACDASNPVAVKQLRDSKQRPSKPFALMAFDIETIQQYVELSEPAKRLLANSQAPIVLMPIKGHPGFADFVAPGLNHLGFMLPYTPLHLLLLQPQENYPRVLVMTSGNLSDAPILHENVSARVKLRHIADAFLMHNRPIHRRIDDSVCMIHAGETYPVRRARGYAPNPIRLDKSQPQVLAVGPQMKNSFCLTRDKYAFLSHYIGEMDTWETIKDFHSAVQDYEDLFRIQPQVIAYDMHPDYATTNYALSRISEEGLAGLPIQHHHAHLAACAVENGISPEYKVGGFIFDGTGYGTDGTIWGGEIFIGNCDEFFRFASLKPLPLPGGEAAIRKPARMALSTLWAYSLPWDERLAPVAYLSTQEREILRHQLENQVNTPTTSSMGRLFDAVSALIGVQEEITYDAQAAIELEALVRPGELGYYPWQFQEPLIDLKPMLEAILDDIFTGLPKTIISSKFHNTIANICLELAMLIHQRFSIEYFALSGGVWQNLNLLNPVVKQLKMQNLNPLTHKLMPTNDGCISFGQAMICASKFKND